MPSLHLRLLGAAQLSASGGLPWQVGNRTLALLAVAAAGGPFGISRDAAMLIFWPDSDPARGRNSLRQRLFTLRRELNVEPLIQTPETLRLDPAIISVDLWEFDAAMASNQPKIAASLYSGPFMDGFSVAGMGELERWIEGERSRLRGIAMRAMDRLAAECTRHGDHASAVEWRRRLAAMDPLSSRVSADLVHALVGHKDRVGALQHARVHTELVRQELDTEPDPAFLALVQSLDLRTSPRPAPLKFEPHSDPAHRLSDPRSGVVRDRVADPGRSSGSEQKLPPRSAPHLRFPWLAVAALLLVGGSLGWRSWQTRSATTGGGAQKALVLVGHFASADDSLDPAFGRGITRLLTAALNETGELNVVAPGKTNEPAKWVVTGSIARTGDRVRIEASLTDLGRNHSTPITLQGPANRTFELVEQLATQVAVTQRRRR